MSSRWTRHGVGIVGVGRMGMAICARVAEAGVPVTATDARRELEPSDALGHYGDIDGEMTG